MATQSRAPVRRLAMARLISITGGAAAYLTLNYTIYKRTGSATWVAAALFLTAPRASSVPLRGLWETGSTAVA